jgi:hypothetical protein
VAKSANGKSDRSRIVCGEGPSCPELHQFGGRKFRWDGLDKGEFLLFSQADAGREADVRENRLYSGERTDLCDGRIIESNVGSGYRPGWRFFVGVGPIRPQPIERSGKDRDVVEELQGPEALRDIALDALAE